jgi:hypothetical protein
MLVVNHIVVVVVASAILGVIISWAVAYADFRRALYRALLSSLFLCTVFFFVYSSVSVYKYHFPDTAKAEKE